MQHELFVEYMRSLEHPKTDVIAALHPNRYIMQWCSTENIIDCGIFLMRHMDHYRGEEIEKWDCGFFPESQVSKKPNYSTDNKVCSKTVAA